MPVVETTSGRVDGIDRGASLAFYGIPYAASTAGPGRFHAPAPVAPWRGVRAATERGLAAPQGEHSIVGFAASGRRGEDCLNLNVFTPAADGVRRPVMVWIHGGGHTHGAGYEPLYDGRHLAERGDVVVVTLNYRLGVLGYLDLRSRLGPAGGVTANAGLLDQVAALRWVQANIGAFGGDPASVTLFGESAGAGAVGTLLATPAARGLFHRAVMQSGTGRAAEPADAERLIDSVLEEAGLDPGAAARLCDLPWEAIVEAQTRAAARAQREGRPPAFGPVRDGDVVPRAPLEAVRAGEAADVPVLIGTNRDEVKLFVAVPNRPPIEDAALPGMVARALGPGGEGRAPAVIAAFRRSREALGLPTSNGDLFDAIASELRFRSPAMRFALAQRAHQPRTYQYLFTWESPARRGAFGACHALEMPFVFGTLDAPTQDRFAGTGPQAERLAAHMMDAWLAFARTGDPAHPGIGAWPAYDGASRPTMVFSGESGLAHDPLAEERLAVGDAGD